MVESLALIINAVMPLFVAIITVFGGVMVAKMNKIQKDIKTNHGSKNLGDAVDIIWNKIDTVSERVSDIAITLEAMQSRDESLSKRVDALEYTKHRLLKQLNIKSTGPVRIMGRHWRKK